MFIIPPIGKLLKRDVLLLQVVPTLVVFLVLFAFAIVSWRSAEATLQAQKNQTINEKMAGFQDTLKSRTQASDVLLRAGTGLFGASEAVSAKEWTQLYSNFDVQRKFAGVDTIGYAPVVEASGKSAFEATLRAENNNPSLVIKQSDNQRRYVPVMYLEHFGTYTSDGLGYNMNSDAASRIAMDKAAATGAPIMTTKLRLFNGKSSGVFQYMPVYMRGASLASVEERRKALKGFVFATIRPKELFAQSLSATSRFNFAVKDTGESGKQELLFTSIDKNNLNSDELLTKPVRTSGFEVLGQKWEIELLASNGIVSATDDERPSTILTAGVAISLIASVAVYLLIQFRTRSFALMEERKLQQAKDELLSLASHQLRTPATGVKQYIGMVLDGFGGRLLKGQVKLLDQAYKSNERQLQIINEFLYVAKLGSGSLTTTTQKFDLVPVVKDVVEEMSLEVKEKGHKLKVIIPQTSFVMADEHSVRMILENMLSNAIKYTSDQGKVEVVLRKMATEVQVMVKDNGVGIDKRDQHLLFKQFSRIPNEFSVNVNGSGIGLYLSQQLAGLNGGSISVVSELGEGSVFTLHLPKKSVKNLTTKRKVS